MDIVLLRTLAWKSKMTVGQFAGSTVEDLFAYDPDILRFYYYCYERISFNDDVLEALGIGNRPSPTLP